MAADRDPTPNIRGRALFFCSLRVARALRCWHTDCFPIFVMAHPPISRCSLRSSCISHFALDNAADAVLWTDPGGAVLYANRSAARLLGKDVDELVGLQLSACAPDLASSVNVNAKQPFQSACVRADGLRIPVEVSVSSFEVDAQQCN